jgi:putative heme-binding domain-containing protein
MRMKLRILVALTISTAMTTTAALGVKGPADDPFAQNVRATEPRSPQDEQKTFHLPDGFQIQLIASEPQIHKPLDLNFDTRGRLWLTQTHMYPFAGKPGQPFKDSIVVLEDVKGDGSFSKVTTFAENLNIPMGIYPVGDGRSVIAYDCGDGPTGQTCLYTDTDGDGRADAKKVLYTGWGFDRDTHGMSNNYRRGFDGWIYGLHGFNNMSAVKGSDGQVVQMRSGNTFRFRLDGSHIELFTEGQINPHGMCFDPMGNMYDSDSHSKPIYQILRGGKYEAFDRNTDDGLGLAPRMMEHLHGSTAIAGSQFYADDKFPQQFRGEIFTGNVVTCRINLDKLEMHGSSPRAIEQPDFLSTDDPWFRPVAIYLGPDGALYVSDFYNRIIGHYEVKLDDPRRDYERGRLWRISYGTAKQRPFDISKDDAAKLIALLGDPNLTARLLATDELSGRIGKDAIAPVTAMLKDPQANEFQKVHGLWVLYRLNALTDELLAPLAKDPRMMVRSHVMRVIAETRPQSSGAHDIALARLKDADPLVQRCAAEALGQSPAVENVRPLLDLLASTKEDDTHLIYVTKMALRNQLRPPATFAKLGELNLSDAQVRTIADMCVAVDTPQGATFLLDHIGQLGTDKESLTNYLRHAVRFTSTPNVAPLATLMRDKFADDLDLQLDLFQSVRQGLDQRGQPMPDALRQWGESIATSVLQQDAPPSAWTYSPLDPNDTAALNNPWDYETRRIGTKIGPMLSSLPGGEASTGVLRSTPFAVPSKLAFWLGGHMGDPSSPANQKNVVRLKLVEGDKVIAERFPPRDDVARKVTWDLHDHAGQQGYLEITDADTGNAYAWLDFGRFDPAVVPMPAKGPHAVQKRLQTAAELAGTLKLDAAAPDLIKAMLNAANDTETRGTIASSLAMLRCDDAVQPMQRIVTDPKERMALRDRVGAALGAMGTPSAQKAIVESFRLAPAELQTALAMALTSNTASAQELLDAVADGKAPARLLLEPGMHDRLAAANVPDLDKRVKQLTRGIFAPKEQLEKLITQRRAGFRTATPSAGAGQAVFAKNCIQCHQIEGKGGLVGPNLAGLSKRGIDRLVEDVLDPNRNVDPAFRYSNVILKDGRLITGLQKKEEGEVLTFADTTGKLVTVNKSEIRQRIESPASLMPSNFAEIIKHDDFNNLMAYLLSK